MTEGTELVEKVGYQKRKKRLGPKSKAYAKKGVMELFEGFQMTGK